MNYPVVTCGNTVFALTRFRDFDDIATSMAHCQERENTGSCSACVGWGEFCEFCECLKE